MIDYFSLENNNFLWKFQSVLFDNNLWQYQWIALISLSSSTMMEQLVEESLKMMMNLFNTKVLSQEYIFINGGK